MIAASDCWINLFVEGYYLLPAGVEKLRCGEKIFFRRRILTWQDSSKRSSVLILWCLSWRLFTTETQSTRRMHREKPLPQQVCV